MTAREAWQDGEPTYQQRIEAMRALKSKHTETKVQMYGYFDTDDHGYIPWTEPISFEPVPSHPSGGCWGIKAIGESFRRWLEDRVAGRLRAKDYFLTVPTAEIEVDRP